MIKLFIFREKELSEEKEKRIDYSSVYVDSAGLVYCAECPSKWLKEHYNAKRHYRKFHNSNHVKVYLLTEKPESPD